MLSLKQNRHLSGNMLKILGAVFMLIDHIGLYMEEYRFLRIIGRLSMPLFAFMISEGTKYTRNKLKYFMGIFCLGVLCQFVEYIYNDSTYMGILITFSISILLIYLFDKLKQVLLDNDIIKKTVWLGIFILAVTGVYVLNIYVEIDYGFWGCMLPLLISVFNGENHDIKIIRMIMIFIGLVLVSVSLGGIQWYCILSLPFIAMYSGKRGEKNLKYFFYIFYPLHLVILEIIFSLL